MARRKPKTCSLGPKGLKPCWPLDEVLEVSGQGTKYQGLKLSTMCDTTTLKFSRHLVVLKSGQHSKKGLVLNFCPFCREELVAGRAEELAASRDGGAHA